MALELNENNFEAEVINSDKPVLVDFWAEWCGPCKMIGPVIDQLADEVTDFAKVGKVNVDHSQELAAKYRVQSIPYLAFFKGGEVVDQVMGAGVSKDQLAERLKKLV